MPKHTLLEAVRKLLPYAEVEQDNLYHLAKQEPDEYQGGYEDCRHAVSYAYEALNENGLKPRRDLVVKARRRKKGLPPDPEGMNDSRAQWAGGCLTDFQSATGCDDAKTALGDLLGDLMHWCDRNDCGFDEALRMARMHYEAETTTGF